MFKTMFQKGNKIATVNKGGIKPKTEQWNNIVGWLAGEGGVRYKQLLQSQSCGQELNDSEREFMDRFYDLLEFHQPKLARTEVTGKDGEKFTGITVYLPNANMEAPSKTGDSAAQ